MSMGDKLRAAVSSIFGYASRKPQPGLFSDASDYPTELDGADDNGVPFVLIRQAPRDTPREREPNYRPGFDDVLDPAINKDI